MYSPLLPRPSAQSNQVGRRRGRGKRKRWFGVIVKEVANKILQVKWDDGSTKECIAYTLKVEGRTSATQSNHITSTQQTDAVTTSTNVTNNTTTKNTTVVSTQQATAITHETTASVSAPSLTTEASVSFLTY